MDTHFDVLVLGTGLTESITAAALSKAGFRVIHVDQNAYYGADEATLSHEELLQWSHSSSSLYSNFSSSSNDPLPFSRAYSLSLAPALIPSAGPLINALILSGVSRYGQFKILDAVYIYRHDVLERVPGNKEDVFKARNVSLIDKRKLMRFLQFASGDFEGQSEIEGQGDRPFGDFMKDKFSLGEEACEAILYALAYCSTLSDPTLPALKRLRGFLRSAGRYGNSPFLIGHYGGLGELAQGFCRSCAVQGGTYILGRKILSLRLPTEASTPETSRASIQLEEAPDILTADLVISSQDYLPRTIVSDRATEEPVYLCGIVIIDRPIAFPLTVQPSVQTLSDEEATARGLEGTAPEQSFVDTAVIVFAPGSLPEGKGTNVVRILQMGDGTLSCPEGKYILYLWTQADSSSDNAKDLLQPYLSVIISSGSENDSQASCVDFSFFYTRRRNSNTPCASNLRTLVVPQLPPIWTEIADQSAEDAESLFWNTVKVLKHGGEIAAFWPPREAVDDNSGDEG